MPDMFSEIRFSGAYNEKFFPKPIPFYIAKTNYYLLKVTEIYKISYKKLAPVIACVRF